MKYERMDKQRTNEQTIEQMDKRSGVLVVQAPKEIVKCMCTVNSTAKLFLFCTGYYLVFVCVISQEGKPNNFSIVTDLL